MTRKIQFFRERRRQKKVADGWDDSYFNFNKYEKTPNLHFLNFKNHSKRSFVLYAEKLSS